MGGCAVVFEIVLFEFIHSPAVRLKQPCWSYVRGVLYFSPWSSVRSSTNIRLRQSHFFPVNPSEGVGRKANRSECQSYSRDAGLFPQPATQNKSNAQSHEHRLGWVLLNICSDFCLPRLRPRLCIRPSIFYYIFGIVWPLLLSLSANCLQLI